jgi:hypothetical protein
MSVIDRLYFWTLRYDPRTWAGHSLLTVAAGSFVGHLIWRVDHLDWPLALAIGLSLALAVYVAREALEMHDNWQSLRYKVFDHFMDILCPALAINLVHWVLT